MGNDPSADSPTSVLEDEENCVLVADNGRSSHLLSSMVEDEEKLLESRNQQEDEMPQEAPKLNDSQFTKLDELLTQTQLYSEFLMENIDKDEMEQKTETAEKKGGRGTKRKAALQYNAGKARRVVAAMIAGSNESDVAEDVNLRGRKTCETAGGVCAIADWWKVEVLSTERSQVVGLLMEEWTEWYPCGSNGAW